MERIWKCARFALARIWKSAVIVTIIYFAFIIGLTTLINAVTPDGPKTVQSGLILFVVIYTFFFMYSLYKNMWNNLLLFGNTRTTSFSGILLATLCADAAFAILSVLSDGFTVVWSRVMHFTGGSIYGILDPQASPIQGVWYYFCLLFAVSCFGLLYGTLFYKIGRAFHAIFWIAFATFWSVGIPMQQTDFGGCRFMVYGLPPYCSSLFARADNRRGLCRHCLSACPPPTAARISAKCHAGCDVWHLPISLQITYTMHEQISCKHVRRSLYESAIHELFFPDYYFSDVRGGHAR